MILCVLSASVVKKRFTTKTPRTLSRTKAFNNKYETAPQMHYFLHQDVPFESGTADEIPQNCTAEFLNLKPTLNGRHYLVLYSDQSLSYLTTASTPFIKV